MPKRARGLMVRYAAEHHITDPEMLKCFNYEGYAFNAAASNETNGYLWGRNKTNKNKKVGIFWKKHLAKYTNFIIILASGKRKRGRAV